MFASLKAMILILQHIWRPYQEKTWKNTSRQWMMILKFLQEGTHGKLIQGSQLLITMYFQKHGTSSAIEKLIRPSVNSRHNIV